MTDCLVAPVSEFGAHIEDFFPSVRAALPDVGRNVSRASHSRDERGRAVAAVRPRSWRANVGVLVRRS
jgi:hypothetical protein